MKNSLLIPFSFLFASATAQMVRTPISFAYTRLAAYSNAFGDAFSFAANQGSLAAAKKVEAGVYSEKRFLLKALSAYSAALVLPTASGNFGIKGDYMGELSYNESAFSLAYARNLGSKAALGLQFNYTALKVAGYGAASTINFDAGVLFHLTPQLNGGVHLYNPVAMGWGKDGAEELPSLYSVGLGYDASTQVFVGLEAEKWQGRPVGVNTGIHYQLAEKLIVRGGIQSATASYFLGFGVKLKSLRLDATVTLHPYLGATPGLLLLYTANE